MAEASASPATNAFFQQFKETQWLISDKINRLQEVQRETDGLEEEIAQIVNRIRDVKDTLKAEERETMLLKAELSLKQEIELRAIDNVMAKVGKETEKAREEKLELELRLDRQRHRFLDEVSRYRLNHGPLSADDKVREERRRLEAEMGRTANDLSDEVHRGRTFAVALETGDELKWKLDRAVTFHNLMSDKIKDGQSANRIIKAEIVALESERDVLLREVEGSNKRKIPPPPPPSDSDVTVMPRKFNFFTASELAKRSK